MAASHKTNIAQKPDHETQNAEAQTALTEAALDEVNEGHESPIRHARPDSVISGLSIDQNWNVDSDVATDKVSSIDSVRSGIYQYVEENGRRYHKYKEGKYYFPNDEDEQDRLDLQHQLFLPTLDGKLNLAPIEKVSGGIHTVLDIGTGTGIWAIDFVPTFHPPTSSGPI
jgi:hypothetical protein